MLRKSAQRLVGLALFAVVFMAIAVAPALAHVELESSSPVSRSNAISPSARPSGAVRRISPMMWWRSTASDLER